MNFADTYLEIYRCTQTRVCSYFYREVVLELLNHRDWRKMMENHYVDGHELASPMRQLIEKFPGMNMDFWS